MPPTGQRQTLMFSATFPKEIQVRTFIIRLHFPGLTHTHFTADAC
jgi:hypothetical protein